MTISDREAKLKVALAHLMFKDHALKLDCAGCLDVCAWLTVEGYDGHLQAPLLRIGSEAI